MTATLEARRRLFTGVLPEEACRVLEPGDKAWPQHLRPTLVLAPRSVEELQEVVAAAFREGVGLVPLGGDLEPRLPREEPVPAVLLSLSGLQRLIAHEAGDLTCTVQAGMTLKQAQLLVRPAGQEVPLSAPWPERATLGGIVARAEEGPTLAPWGPVRDQVLGIEVVHGDGRLARAGGRVVKNVTGYDLMRLYTGSRGVLGVICSMTLRLRPAPETARFVLQPHSNPGDALQQALHLRRTHTALFGVHLLHGACLQAWDTDPETWAVLATACGSSALVERLCRDCAAEGPGGTARELEAGRWKALQTPFPQGGFRFRAAVLPERLPDLLEACAPLLVPSGGLVVDVLAGRLEHSGEEGWQEEREAELGARLEPLGAWVDLPSDPRFHLRRFQRFPSTRPGGLALMHRVVRALDPGGILNPGRTELTS